MKFKKLFLGVSTGALALAPTIAVIACGASKNDGTITLNSNIFEARAKVDSPLNLNGKLKDWKSILAVDGPGSNVNDKSFNESAYAGMLESSITSIIKLYNDGTANSSDPSSTKPGEKTNKSFTQMYRALNPKTLIVATGFLHVAPLNSDLTSINGKAVILIDGDVKAANIASVTYKSHQSGFMAGYMSGIYLNKKYETFKDGGLKVGTFGGMNIEGVTPFMMGFQNGIKYFNANKGEYKHNIDFIDNGGKADYFSGNFNSGQGKTIAENLIGKGADLIFPVAGPQTLDVVEKLKEAKNTKTKIVGVDVAQEKDPALKDYVVFSALKKIKESVMKMIQIINGNKSSTDPGYNSFEGFGGVTIGDIDNGLVGVSEGLTSNTEAKASYDETIKQEIKDAAKSEKHNPLKFDY